MSFFGNATPQPQNSGQQTALTSFFGKPQGQQTNMFGNTTQPASSIAQQNTPAASGFSFSTNNTNSSVGGGGFGGFNLQGQQQQQQQQQPQQQQQQQPSTANSFFSNNNNTNINNSNSTTLNQPAGSSFSFMQSGQQSQPQTSAMSSFATQQNISNTPSLGLWQQQQGQQGNLNQSQSNVTKYTKMEDLPKLLQDKLEQAE